MGSTDTDKLADSDEKPQHEITLPAFRIGKYPVTCAQYLLFVEATGHDWRWDEGRKPERGNHPVTYVSWYDARAYCDWLTERWLAEGRIGPTEAVRLSSEAEWEKAARGLDGNLWPWGNEWDATCCNADMNVGDTTSVGMFPKGASPYRCMDMAGNVWEWTSSKRTDYPSYVSAESEDETTTATALRVLRGGAFFINRSLARCAYRFRFSPNGGYRYFGFRVVVSPISPPSAL
jgi:iron(II)-dependent oxidoreductase